MSGARYALDGAQERARATGFVASGFGRKISGR
jgi:hypothetical protein